MTPPTNTPNAAAALAIIAHTDRARLRSGPSGNVLVITDSAAGETIAAPSPCTARAAISHPGDCARPQASDAMVNRTTPVISTRRRPSRSAARPPSSRQPPKVST